MTKMKWFFLTVSKLMKYINKNLTIEKVKVQEIAKKFGTPTYCYSYKQLKKNIKDFKKNFSSFLH